MEPILTPSDPHLEYVCDQLVLAINTALRSDRQLDDHHVAVNPSTEQRMVVYWRTRPRRWEVRRFKRLVRRAMRQLLKTDNNIRPEDLYYVAPHYTPPRYEDASDNGVTDSSSKDTDAAEGSVYSALS